MDDDSYIESNFDNIIGKNDSLIVSKEFNEYKDDCYHLDNHLSLTYLINKYNCTDHKNTITDIFGGRSLVSWALFAAPRNPLFKRTLENVVDLLKHEVGVCSFNLHTHTHTHSHTHTQTYTHT